VAERGARSTVRVQSEFSCQLEFHILCEPELMNRYGERFQLLVDSPCDSSFWLQLAQARFQRSTRRPYVKNRASTD